jgi:hypothetical protein
MPAGKGVRVIGIATWHACQSKEMLREEHELHADAHQPEMQLPSVSLYI